jgi:hypothetical protein
MWVKRCVPRYGSDDFVYDDDIIEYSNTWYLIPEVSKGVTETV